MLDKGFENDIRRIIALTKDISQRQTVMCRFKPDLVWILLTANLSQRNMA